MSSHPDCPDLDDVRAIYYNNKFFGGTRDEKRLTGFGRQNPLQNPENTGALALLAFDHVPGTSSSYCDVWVCKDLTEEDILEPIIGEVIPGATIFGPGDKIIEGSLQKLLLAEQSISFHPNGLTTSLQEGRLLVLPHVITIEQLTTRTHN